jgi:hypothetical protein
MNGRRRDSGEGQPRLHLASSGPPRGAAPSEMPTVRPPPYAPADSIPVPVLRGAELRKLHLDRYAGFLLSLMDGVTTVEMLLDVCAMPTADAMRVLDELVRSGVVELKDGVPTRKAR